MEDGSTALETEETTRKPLGRVVAVKGGRWGRDIKCE
jgi:hypothetical protein